jgi:1,2-diacylglycerol 3-alpha-glucosyltransferase
MRIAIFTDCFVPQINGVVTSLFNLVKGLSDSGHHVFIVAPKYYRRYKEFAYPKVRVLRIPSVPAFFYPDYRLTFPVDLKILAILRKSDIDIINFETPLTVGLTGIIMARMLNKPLIGRFHTFIADPQYLKHGFPMSKEFQ